MEIFNALLQIDLENFVGNILKERLEIDSFSKSDLFIAVEFNKAGKEWAGGMIWVYYEQLWS